MTPLRSEGRRLCQCGGKNIGHFFFYNKYNFLLWFRNDKVSHKQDSRRILTPSVTTITAPQQDSENLNICKHVLSFGE